MHVTLLTSQQTPNKLDAEVELGCTTSRCVLGPKGQRIDKAPRFL